MSPIDLRASTYQCAADVLGQFFPVFCSFSREGHRILANPAAKQALGLV
jgi:hypothetical protein